MKPSEIKFICSRLIRPHNKRVCNGTTLIIGGWLIAGLLFCPTDNGGSGLALAFNILTWLALALTLVWLSMTLPPSLCPAGFPGYITAGAVAWTLPVFWCQSAEDRLSSLPHILALWGFLTVLWWLRCLPIQVSRRTWPGLLWATALAQGIYGLFQTLTDKALARPMGTFYQPNVFASMMATGLACLLFSRWSASQEVENSNFRRIESLALVFLPFILVLAQSRTGWLGAMVAAGILFLSAIRTMPVRMLLADLALMLAGIMLALAWQHGLFVVSKVASGESRLLILHTTWHLIQQHPLSGWGYGSFERNFGNQLVADNAGHGLPLIHPHNELLYAWAEGGVPALAGILLMVVGVFVGLWRLGGLRWRGVAMLFPLAAHINLEYPLYQSVPHGLMLCLLLSMSMAPTGVLSDKGKRAARFRWIRVGTLVSATAVIVFMTGTLQTQRQLVAVERTAMIPLARDEHAVIASLWNRYGLAERLDYDRHVALLMRYNLTRDVRLLFRFDRWAERWLQRHADTNVAVSRLMIARAIMPARYPAMCSELHRRYPDEPRITCPTM